MLFRCQGCSLTSLTCWYDDHCRWWTKVGITRAKQMIATDWQKLSCKKYSIVSLLCCANLLSYWVFKTHCIFRAKRYANQWMLVFPVSTYRSTFHIEINCDICIMKASQYWVFSCEGEIREDIRRKKSFTFGHCPNKQFGQLGPFSPDAKTTFCAYDRKKYWCWY